MSTMSARAPVTLVQIQLEDVVHHGPGAEAFLLLDETRVQSPPAVLRRDSEVEPAVASCVRVDRVVDRRVERTDGTTLLADRDVLQMTDGLRHVRHDASDERGPLA